MSQRNKLLIVYCIMILVVILATVVIASRTSCQALSQETYIVKPGDTIWDLAGRYCPKGMSFHEWICRVRELNHTDGMIYPGDELKILKGE